MDSVWSVCVSPDGKFIVSESKDNLIEIFNTQIQSQYFILTNTSFSLTSIEISGDEKFIIGKF